MHTWLAHVIIEKGRVAFLLKRAKPETKQRKKSKEYQARLGLLKKSVPFEEKKEQVKRSFFKRDEDDYNMNVDRRQDEGHQMRLTDMGFERTKTNTEQDTEESCKELMKF